MTPAMKMMTLFARHVMRPPDGFTWEPPVKVYRAGSVYTTNYRAEDWMVPATADLWCSPTGVDATGTGTQALPYRTIKKCLTIAAGLPDTAINIYVVAGEYGYLGHFSNQACAKDLNVVAVGGRALATNKFPITSWTLDGAGTYKATRASVIKVRDARYLDSYGIPTLLTTAASTVDCQATANSWYTDGTTVWVHLSDGRSPDAGNGGDVAVILSTPSLLFNTDNRWFIKGIDFEGSSTDIIRTAEGVLTSYSRMVMDDCTYRFQTLAAAKAVSIVGLGTAIMVNCRAYHSSGDAFNYHAGSINLISPNVIEIGCQAYEIGASGGDNHFNGSTTHEAVKIMRVNCTYGRAYGPVVADIGTTLSWNMNVTSRDCLLGTADSQDACFQRGDGATGTTWLENCTASGSAYSMYADVAGAVIKHRGGTLTGSTSGAVSVY